MVRDPVYVLLRHALTEQGLTLIIQDADVPPRRAAVRLDRDDLEKILREIARDRPEALLRIMADAQAEQIAERTIALMRERE